MPHDEQGYPQGLAEVLDHDRGCPRTSDPVICTHGATLIHQKAYRQIDRLSREPAVEEDPAVSAMECVLIQPLSHQKAGLLTPLTLISEDTSHRALEPFGELE